MSSEHLKNASILIVDNEEDLLQAFVLLLQPEFRKVSCASNEDDALNLLRHEKFDLVLMDLKFPGVTGIDILKKLRQIQPGLPCIFMSGSSAEEPLVIESLKLSSYKMINKPFSDFDSLLKQIKNVLTCILGKLEN